jgi:hypothetical protein
LAVLDGMTKIARPGNDLLKEVVDALEGLWKASFKRLYPHMRGIRKE